VKDSVKHATKPLKHSPILVAGLPLSGKTTFICALIKLAKKLNLEVAGFKPFDAGLLKRNAEEQRGDGEIISKTMGGEPTDSLIAPYIANENYPLEMALRRDGVRINWEKLQERLLILDEKYDRTLIECPPSLFTPLNEDTATFEWLKNTGKEIIWLIHPVQKQFASNLAEIHLIKSLGLQVHYVLNNATKITDQDLLFYIWEKLESVTKQTMAGMIPFDNQVKESFISLAEKIEDSIPMTIEALLGL